MNLLLTAVNVFFVFLVWLITAIIVLPIIAVSKLIDILKFKMLGAKCLK